jgi:Flp pilus assembly protein TadG
MKTRPRRRPAAAAVELAVLLPFLVTAILGIFEIGRALLVLEALSNAAQIACRTASLPAKANSDVNQDVEDSLAASGISGHSATILVNGVAADVSTAKRNDQISVKVSVPVSKVYWLTTYFVKKDYVESETVVMLRQG